MAPNTLSLIRTTGLFDLRVCINGGLMKNKLLFLILIFCAAINAQQLNNPQLESAALGRSLNQSNNNFFIQNKGQWNPDVKYLARIGGMNAWITNTGVVYDYYRVTKNYIRAKASGNSPDERIASLWERINTRQKKAYENKNTVIQGHVIKMQLINAEKNFTATGGSQREEYYNYFIGSDQSKWAGGVPLYGTVELQGVYKNIDVKYYYDNGMLRYDYKAKPGADVSEIKFKFEGQDGLSINSNGGLVLKTILGDVIHGKIYAYQVDGESQKEVECNFELKDDGSVGIKPGTYDAAKELIIDPLVYSTFIGGNNEDIVNSGAVDAGGNAYITGWSASANYPVTNGAYQTALADSLGNVFVTKLNSTGGALIYSTFIGGNGDSFASDEGNSIKIDQSGNVYITGVTYSTNYPVTSGAFQTGLYTYYGNAFVTKFNSTGSSLIYSTYIGGSYADDALSVAVDSGGNAYITGETLSPDYPVTIGCYQPELYGNENTFITKINPEGSGLVYSTFVGGDSVDEGSSITVDAGGNAYITGTTNSPAYPVTTGAFQDTLGGESFFEGTAFVGDAFITKLNSSGSDLVYSTFIGGDTADVGTSIAVDKFGDAYITGWTSSSNFPVTKGAYQTTYGGGAAVFGDAFVTKLNSTGSALVYSTFIGGNVEDVGRAIAIDAGGNAYITGWTSSPNFPVTKGAYQSALGSDTAINAYVTELNSTGAALLYSTFIGGNNYESPSSILVDSGGNVYITGQTASSNYPITPGAYQTAYGSDQQGSNAFITKLNISAPTLAASNKSNVPGKFELMQNYPNPFNPSTIINYSVPKASMITIKVYDILGREVTALVNEEKSAGNYSVQFSGSKLSSGIYFYQLKSDNFISTKKMLLIK